MSALFSAPLEAVVDAEARYRQIWSKWIKDQMLFLGITDATKGDVLLKVLDTAPVVTLDGKVETALTMRIASVSEHKGGLSAGLQVGPIFASGSYSMMKRSAEESVFQASTQFVISNQGSNLVDYLKSKGLTPPATGKELGDLADKLIKTLPAQS